MRRRTLQFPQFGHSICYPRLLADVGEGLAPSRGAPF